MSDAGEGRAYGEGFIVLPDAIAYARGVAPIAKLLWAIFARHSDPGGRSYPSRKRLADLLDVSEDTITRAKRSLIDAGLIEARERFDTEGRRTTDDVFLRHARRTDAAYPRRTDAATGTRSSSELDKRSLASLPQNQPHPQNQPQAPEHLAPAAAYHAPWVRPPSPTDCVNLSTAIAKLRAGRQLPREAAG